MTFQRFVVRFLQICGLRGVNENVVLNFSLNYISQQIYTQNKLDRMKNSRTFFTNQITLYFKITQFCRDSSIVWCVYSLLSVLRTWPWLGSVCCRLLSRIFLTKSRRPNTWARLLSTAASTMHVSAIGADTGGTINSNPKTDAVEKKP